MIARLASFFQIRPGEGRLAALVAALFICIQAGQSLGANAADSLFFVRFGVEFLPYMFLGLGGLTLIVTLSYSAGLGRFDRRRFFAALLAGLAAILLVERVAILLDLPALYPALWLTVNALGMILGTFVWNLAGEVCDARQAKRLFSLFTSAGILGGVLGNLLTGPAARSLGADNLLALYAALLLLGLALTRAITARFFSPETRRRASGARPSVLADLRAGYDYVRGSRLLILIALASVLFSVLYFSIAFPFSKVVTASFPDEAEVAGFLGLFSSAATGLTFVVSLVIANRLYARLGVVNSILILPLTYLAGFALFAASWGDTSGRPLLAAAAAARLAQLVILGGVAGTAWNALFNVAPSQRRGQVLAFNNGVPSQIGVALSGALLVLGERALTTAQIFTLGMTVALACGLLVWRMRGEYGRALLDALRAGRFEVFRPETAGAGGAGFARFQGDGQAAQVALRALADAKASTRRLAIEMLWRMGATPAVPALIERLADPEAEVRAAAVRALGELEARGAAEAVRRLANDPDLEVQINALRALARLRAALTPALRETIVGLLDDLIPAVRAEAAVALAAVASAEAARAALSEMLRDENADARALALDALARCGDGEATVARMVDALTDAAPLVRRAACRALARLPAIAAGPGPDSAIEPLAARLGDDDESVRAEAAGALRTFGARATASILKVLGAEGAPAHTKRAALEALDPGDAASFEPVRAYARAEIARARRLRGWAAAIRGNVVRQAQHGGGALRAGQSEVEARAKGRVVSRPPAAVSRLPAAVSRPPAAMRLLLDMLTSRAEQTEQGLVKMVGLLGETQAMALVARGLRSREAETRAAAVEALDTLGDKALVKEIIPLLDEAPAGGGQGPAAALAEILAEGDDWLRAVGALAADELGVREFALRSAEGRLTPLTRDALIQSKGASPMETLPTVSSLERILLLREVPLFAELSPDDLRQVAEVAAEEWYPDGTVICAEGEEGDTLYVLVQGNARVTRRSNGDERTLAVRGPGDFIGEMAVIESAPRAATVRAQGEVRALAIRGQAFKAILRDRPEVSLAVLRGLSRRLRQAGEQQ